MCRHRQRRDNARLEIIKNTKARLGKRSDITVRMRAKAWIGSFARIDVIARRYDNYGKHAVRACVCVLPRVAPGHVGVELQRKIIRFVAVLLCRGMCHRREQSLTFTYVRRMCILYTVVPGCSGKAAVVLSSVARIGDIARGCR